MPPQLALHVLGPPQLYLDREPVTASRRKAMALLAYLAVRGSRQTRDSLSALFWPDYDQSKAYTNLRHTLWEVQQAIGEGWIAADRDVIELDSDADISVDIHQFESLLTKSRAQEDAAARVPFLLEAVKLYRNHFLTGFSLKDAPEFNEWAFAKSEELKHELSLALVVLSEDLCTLGQADQAIPQARRLITLDPLNESSHRLLMQVYIHAGQHSAALKQYQACEEILRRELGIDPQPETRELYKQIRRREIKPIQVEKQEEKRVPRHNMPLQLSNFIGREKEQKTVAKLINTHRLVTLIGAGGIGKTRLSLKVGEGSLQQFPHGVWFVELASLNDPALVSQAVSAVFDIKERSESRLSERLLYFLQSKTILLILDNCEHLIDACAQLAEAVLKNCPEVKILATSRESLAVEGEASYRVPSLSMPKGKQDLDQLAGNESIRLFHDRARLSASEFSLTEENLPIVSEICRRLDGIPLAIELAAARVNTLSLEQIAARLHESFRLLTSPHRTRLERQQTLQASIDWSWNLLSDPERILLQRLSMFTGGWTLDAAEFVCSGDSIHIEQVLDLLTQLVTKSLVVVDQEAGSEKHYHLLEMIRQYAYERLVHAAEEETIGKLHLDYFLQLSERIESGMIGPEQASWFTRLSHERDNLRSALTFASNTNIEAGLYLAGRLYRFWESFNMQEGVYWLAELLENPESKKYPHARARALCSYGWLLIWIQQFKPAQIAAEESLELFRACGDLRGELDALPLLGNTLEFQGNIQQSMEMYHETVKRSQVIGYVWNEARAHFFLGWDRRSRKHSFSHLEKAIALFRQVGDQAALANSLSVVGSFRVLDGEVDLAQSYLDEATQLWQSNNRLDIWETAKVARSRLALLRGDYEQAGTLLHEILITAEETGNRMSYLWIRAHLGHVAFRSGDMEEARRLFASTVQDFQKDEWTIGVVFGVEGIATLLIAAGQPETAARLIGWADVTREQIPDVRPPIEEADMYRNMAAILSKIGPSAFEIAYDEGRSLIMQQAVELALKEHYSFLPRDHSANPTVPNANPATEAPQEKKFRKKVDSKT
jgi:predicted ATPase/DNA-binding SARP family transcriptional activator